MRFSNVNIALGSSEIPSRHFFDWLIYKTMTAYFEINVQINHTYDGDKKNESKPKNKIVLDAKFTYLFYVFVKI